MPKIENWFPYAGGLAGKISGHKRQHEFQTDIQLTSPIPTIAQWRTWKEGDIVISGSGTEYELGRPHVDTLFIGYD